MIEKAASIARETCGRKWTYVNQGARVWCFYVVMTGLGLIVSGCATEAPLSIPSQTAALHFPPPPEVARFVFERTIHRGSDLAQERRGGGFRRAITGESAAGVELVKPFDVAVCEGTVYVSDTVARSVVVFDAVAGEVREIGRSEPGLIRKPLGLATDDLCNLYVADGTLRRVAIYDRDGQFLLALGGMDWFDRLSHVAVSGDGSRVYAVDTGGVGSESHWIRVFDTETGRHLRDIGSRGQGEAEFNLPRDITIGPGGTIYVVDGGNFRVQILSAEGAFIRQVGSLGRMYGQFARPKGIAVDADGNIYVSDAAHGNFQIFDEQGALLLFVGSRSETDGPAAYMLPAGIDVDDDGRVYVIDQYFRKVDVFRPAGLAEGEGFLGAWSGGESDQSD
jgi:DNA-binding beta-propeller fold protein YncE